MGRKRTPGLEWLEPENTEQRRWAREYLRAKGLERLFHIRDKILPNEPPSHAEMRHAGMEIEQRAGARELFRDMKDAWRQERSRNKKKDSGHQVCAFTFSSTTKANLQEMALKQQTSATELLETLISKAHKAHISKAKKQKPPQPRPAKTDSNTFAQGRHPLVGDTETAQDAASLEKNVQDDAEATPEPQEAIETTAAAADAPKQMTIPDNQEPAVQDGKSAPDTHEQTDSPQAETPTDDEFAHNTEQAKISIREIVAQKAENRAAREKQARPSVPQQASHSTPQNPEQNMSRTEQGRAASQHEITGPTGDITEK